MNNKNFRPFVYSLLNFAIVLLFGKNIIVSIIFATALFFIAKVLFRVYDEAHLPKDKLERIVLERTNEKQLELESTIETCKKTLVSIAKNENKINNKHIKNKVSSICVTSKKIIESTSIKYLSDIRNFFDYYIPETDKILIKYIDLSEIITTEVEQNNIDDDIWKVLNDIDISLKKILESIFKDDLIMIKSDMNVLQQTVKSEGLASELEIK